MEQPRKMLVLVDGNALMHRAYHGVNKGFIPIWEGMPIGMVFGFASSILNAVEFLKPDILAVTFDTKEKTFRHEMDENYKAQREAAPDDFYPQIPFVEEFLHQFGVPVLKQPGFESDDLIGTLTVEGEKRNFEIRIVSGDLDFLQLVNDHIKLVKLDGKIEHAVQYGPEETFARYGIHPLQMVDYKAIIGDSSDNYKGIPGIGPKGAVKLLQEFGTIPGIYNHIDEVTPATLRKKLENERATVTHCRTLAQIKTDIQIDFDWDQKFKLSAESTLAFFEKMKFRSLSARFQKLIKNYDQTKNYDQKNGSEKTHTEDQMSLF